MSNEQIESHPSEELGRSFRVDLIQMARALNEAQVRHLIFGYSAVRLLPDDPGHDGSGVYHEIELVVPRDTVELPPDDPEHDNLEHHDSEHESGNDPIIQFVVADDMIQAATDAIVASGHPACHDRECSFLQQLLYACAHFHPPSERFVVLHAQSTVLWWLPELPPVRAANASENSLVYPVKTVTERILIEALLLIVSRYHGPVSDLHGNLWLEMLFNELGYGSDERPCIELSKEFQSFWDEPQESSWEDAMGHLWESLIWIDGFPAHPAYPPQD